LGTDKGTVLRILPGGWGLTTRDTTQKNLGMETCFSGEVYWRGVTSISATMSSQNEGELPVLGNGRAGEVKKERVRSSLSKREHTSSQRRLTREKPESAFQESGGGGGKKGERSDRRILPS